MKKILLIIVMVFMLTGIFGFYNKNTKVNASTGVGEVVMTDEEDIENDSLENGDDETADAMGGNVPVIKKDDDTGNTPLGNNDGESESQ